MVGAPASGAVHALMNSIGPTQAAFDGGWPAADVAHLLDGSLYLDRSRGSADEKALAARIDSLLRYSASTGRRGDPVHRFVLRRGRQTARATIAVPVLTSFEVVIDRALDLEQPLHVVATTADSVTLLRAELERGASDRSRSVSVSGQAVAGAMEALTSGDPDRAVVFAQFSMEGVLDRSAAGRGSARHRPGPRKRGAVATVAREGWYATAVVIQTERHRLEKGKGCDGEASAGVPRRGVRVVRDGMAWRF